MCTARNVGQEPCIRKRALMLSLPVPGRIAYQVGDSAGRLHSIGMTQCLSTMVLLAWRIVKQALAQRATTFVVLRQRRHVLDLVAESKLGALENRDIVYSSTAMTVLGYS